ncbi:MAG: hypothetical protein JXA67_22775 [Micromonosporaceae bacterium]|nr:hypothetical protein [Micromonosporaceae bacterium]
MPRFGPHQLLTAWELGIRQGPAERALTLLSAAHVHGSSMDSAHVDVGSREVTLAGLLCQIGGGQVWGSTECCGCCERLDVPVAVDAIAALPVHEPGARFTIAVDGEEVAFRLPTTADLDAVAGLAVDEARDALLRRCLGLGVEPEARQGTGPDTGPPGTGVLAAGLVEAVEAALERIAPAGSIRVLIGCPSCGTSTEAAVDLSVLLWAELETLALALLNDIHTLAAAYGWTEDEILRLSPARRAAYLNLASG